MPSDSGKSTSANLSQILEGLSKAGIDFILVGGLAAVVQGAPITTMDVDIVHHQSPENVARLLAFLKSVAAIHRRPDNIVIEPTEADLTGTGHALYATRIGPLDVLAAIEQGKAYPDLIEHAVAIDFRGHKLNVLDLKMLIQLKKTSPDTRDRQRLPVLEETLRQLEAK